MPNKMTYLQKLSKKEEKELARIQKEQAKATMMRLAREKKKAQELALIQKKQAKASEPYEVAKRKHKKYKQTKQIEKWEREEVHPIKKALTYRKKKGKIGSSAVGRGIHRVLNPFKPLKKGRW